MEIRTIPELLTYIRELHIQHSRGTVYFRGESKTSWELRPSILRDGLNRFEGDMLNELISRRPEDFRMGELAIAHWVLAQHHGLQTRFLDVTRNPLVALFHACDDFPDQAARLHVFAVPPRMIKPFNSDAVSIIANFATLTNQEQSMLISGASRRESLGYADSLRHLYQLIRGEKPNFEERIDVRDLFQVFVIEPQQASERIRAQSGSFLASAYHQRFERDELQLLTPHIPVYAHYIPTIPASSKREILRELSLLNITRETLFPGLDESARAITDAYRQRLQASESTASESD